jgi:dihydropyrimidinase
MLPAVYTSGVLRGRCTIDDLVRVLSLNTAHRFDLYPQKGQLALGADADVIVFDPDLEKQVGPANSLTAAGYSLYDGETLKGWPEKTFLRGQPVFDSGKIVASKPAGRHVPQA